MREYFIDLGELEELQKISDRESLERIFSRAKSTLVNGERVVLKRRALEGTQSVDEITTLEDLERYRETVFRYL